MEQQTQTSTEETAASQELVRPLEGRMVAGVALGLARKFDVTDWVVRALFVITSVFGGLGIVLYLAGWALIRSEEQAEPPAARFFSQAGTTRSWVGIGLIFVAALIILDRITFLSSGVMWAGALLVLGVLLYIGVIPLPGEGGTRPTPPRAPGPDAGKVSEATEEVTDTPSVRPSSPPRPTPSPPTLPPAAFVPKERSILGRLTIGFMLLGVGLLAVLDILPGVGLDARPRHYMALATVILGIGLLVGSLWGRARWLILVGMILVPTLLFSPLTEREWGAVRWNTLAVPATFEEIPASYEVEVGRLEIDLTHLPWDGEEITLLARAKVGRVIIWVPYDVGINGVITVNVGSVRSAQTGDAAVGLGSPRVFIEIPGTSGTIHLDARAGVGTVEIQEAARMGG